MDDYIDEINNCYDVDGDLSLNKSELAFMIEGKICGGECPPKGQPSLKVPDGGDTELLTAKHLFQLQSFFGNRSFHLEKLYSSVEG